MPVGAGFLFGVIHDQPQHGTRSIGATSFDKRMEAGLRHSLSTVIVCSDKTSKTPVPPYPRYGATGDPSGVIY